MTNNYHNHKHITELINELETTHEALNKMRRWINPRTNSVNVKELSKLYLNVNNRVDRMRDIIVKFL